MVRPDDTVEHTIDSRLVIVIFNGSLRAKPKNQCIIQSIDADEAGDNSRVMPGYCQECSEASVKGNVYQKAQAKRAKSVIHYNPPNAKRVSHPTNGKLFNNLYLRLSCKPI